MLLGWHPGIYTEMDAICRLRGMSLLLAGNDQPRVFGKPGSPEMRGVNISSSLIQQAPSVGKVSSRDPKVLY